MEWIFGSAFCCVLCSSGWSRGSQWERTAHGYEPEMRWEHTLTNRMMGRMTTFGLWTYRLYDGQKGYKSPMISMWNMECHIMMTRPSYHYHHINERTDGVQTNMRTDYMAIYHWNSEVFGGLWTCSAPPRYVYHFEAESVLVTHLRTISVIKGQVDYVLIVWLPLWLPLRVVLFVSLHVFIIVNLIVPFAFWIFHFSIPFLLFHCPFGEVICQNDCFIF